MLLASFFFIQGDLTSVIASSPLVAVRMDQALFFLDAIVLLKISLLVYRMKGAFLSE